MQLKYQLFCLYDLYLLPSKDVASAGMRASPSSKGCKISDPSSLVVEGDSCVKGVCCRVVGDSSGDNDLNTGTVGVAVRNSAGRRCGIF